MEDLHNFPLHVQLETDMFSYCDSFHALRAHDRHRQFVSIPGSLDRDVHTGRVNRFDVMSVSLVAASSSPRLIGPTAPIRINTLVMVIANVFMVVFPFFDHSTRDRVLTPLNLPGKTYLYV